MKSQSLKLSRRSFLLAGGGLALASILPSGRAFSSNEITEIALHPAPGRAALVGPPHPDTKVWCYNERVPGPEIRVPQAGHLKVTVHNGLNEETTVHWHGVRVPNAMDGVPHLTQKPIAPDDRFVYEFDVPDAGTYWYHPHQRSAEQVDRGLSGVLIVEEPEPPQVDRDIVWVLDDWRLTREAEIQNDFGDMHDVTHNGRIGNTVTINGRVSESFPVRAGERIRLRLINAANARIFGLVFAEHSPVVIALDGQPVKPHTPTDNRVVLAPAQRVDLIIDMDAKPDQRYTVTDSFYRQFTYRLVDLHYQPERLRKHVLDAPARLPENPLSIPVLANAKRHIIEFGGGMMNPKMMRGQFGHDMRGMMSGMHQWTINGVSQHGHAHPPLLTLERGNTYIFDMHNDTAWHHPMHLHGMTFQVLTRDGQRLPHRVWQDTVLMNPDEHVEIAFVADNPGDWMFHCHILEHQEGGMMGTIRVI